MKSPIGFPDSSLIHDGGFFGVWRVGDVLGLRIVGVLDDERNPVWRAYLDAYIEESGWPRFAMLDVSETIPAASMAKRIQTAQWGRKVSAHIERGILFVGQDARVGFAVRAILRVASTSRLEIVNDEREFGALARALIEGRDGP